MEYKIKVCGPTGIFLFKEGNKFFIDGKEVSKEEYYLKTNLNYEITAT